MNTGAPRDDDGYAGTPFRVARKEPLLQRAVPVIGDFPTTARARGGAT